MGMERRQWGPMVKWVEGEGLCEARRTGQWRRWWRERYDLVRGMFVNFLSLWMVCARVTLIWGVLRGGKGSIRPKVRFENSAYGQGLNGNICGHD